MHYKIYWGENIMEGNIMPKPNVTWMGVHVTARLSLGEHFNNCHGKI